MKHLLAIITCLTLANCAALTPSPSMPCAGLYCLEWDGTGAGLPADVLICAKTEALAREAAAPLLAAHPKSTVRKAGK